MPEVSVIIPNFNHAQYLKRRIDSVLNQTFTDFEVIILDDCSTDNSVEIINSYVNHPAISHVVINKENSGSPFKQWKKGFELSKGKYIWIAESDDWCELNLLEILMKPLIIDKSVVLAFCQTKVMSEKGEIIYKTTMPFYDKTITGRDFIAGYMFGDPVLINSGMVVFRKDALQNIDPEFVNFKSAGDWMFWNSVAIQGNVFISGAYLNYFSRYKTTISSRAEVSGIDMKEGCMMFKWVKENTSPTIDEINNAVKQRMNLYLIQKNKFGNSNIRKEALNNLSEIIPGVKRYLIFTQLKRILKKLIQ